MGINAWSILGIAGVVGVGALALYAYNRDSKDPLGVLEDIWNDTFVEGGKFIVPKALRTKGGIIPKNLDRRDVTEGLQFDRPVDVVPGWGKH